MQTSPAETPAPYPSELDRRVYRAIACYCPDEAVCWPSQDLIAEDLGISRETVNRSCARLRRAGWLIWVRLKSAISRWQFNRYELLEPFEVSALAMKRITRRAHRRRRLAKLEKARSEAQIRGGSGLDHTNKEVEGDEGRSWCCCKHCRSDRTGITRRPPPIRPTPLGERWRIWMHHREIEEMKRERAERLERQRQARRQAA